MHTAMLFFFFYEKHKRRLFLNNLSLELIIASTMGMISISKLLKKAGVLCSCGFDVISGYRPAELCLCKGLLKSSSDAAGHSGSGLRPVGESL